MFIWVNILNWKANSVYIPLDNNSSFVLETQKPLLQVLNSFTVLQEVYKPQRKYKRQSGAEELLDEESKVHSTLLEYGRWKASFSSLWVL